MRTIIRLSFGVVLALCFAAVSYAQPQRPQPRAPSPAPEIKKPAYMKMDANLHITVVDQGTGSRMSEVKVVITERSTGETVSKPVTTDSFGMARFNVPDGEYVATLTKTGFISTSSPFVKAGPSSFTFNTREYSADDLMRPVSSIGVISPGSRTNDGERFAITVTSAARVPVEGVKVFVGSTARDVTTYRLGTTNASGVAEMRVPDGDVMVIVTKEGYVPNWTRLTKAGVVERSFMLEAYTIFSRDICSDYRATREVRDSCLCGPVTVPLTFWVREVGAGDSYADVAYATVLFTVRAGSVYYAIKGTTEADGMVTLDMPSFSGGATFWIISNDHWPETFVAGGTPDASSEPISVFLLRMPWAS